MKKRFISKRKEFFLKKTGLQALKFTLVPKLRANCKVKMIEKKVSTKKDFKQRKKVRKNFVAASRDGAADEALQRRAKERDDNANCIKQLIFHTTFILLYRLIEKKEKKCKKRRFQIKSLVVFFEIIIIKKNKNKNLFI